MRTRARAIVVSVATVTTALATVLVATPAANADPDPSSGTAAYAGSTRQLAVAALSHRLGIGAAEANARLDALDRRSRTALRLERQMGAATAGSYLDPGSGRLIVNITRLGATLGVALGGAQPRMVTRDMSSLRRVQAALDGGTAIPGTAWGIDVAHNTVTVRVSPTAQADARIGGWMRTLAGYGDAVRVERTAGFRTTALFGGEAIISAFGSGRCSAGFNGVGPNGPVVITAGHCTDAIDAWTDGDGVPIGRSDVVEFPGNDFGTITVDDAATLGPQPAVLTNGQVQPINGDLRVPVGGLVCKSGSTTGTTCGTVQAYDQTVVYAEGRVSGLTETDVCVQPGDSGGSLFAGDQAQGLVSGGTDAGCDVPGFVSFFQPVDEVLQATGVQLLSA